MAPPAPAARASLALVVLLGACTPPLVPVFSLSGDAPSRTGLTPLGEGAVFGNDAGRVIRLDGAGRLQWVVETGGAVELPLAVTDDGVVGALTGGDTLVALDADTGHERWRAGGQPDAAAVTGVGSRLLLLAREGELRSFAARSGGMPLRRGWNASLGIRPRTPARGLLSLGDGALAIGPAAVLSLSAEDGALRWKAPVHEPLGAIVDGEQVWVVEQPGRLLALDRRTGAQRRAVPLGQRAASPPSLALGRVWVGLEDRALVGIDTRGVEPAWRASLPALLLGGVAEWQDRVLVPTAGREGRLLAIDLAHPGSPATARVDSALRTRPLVHGPVSWVLAADGRVLGYRFR